MNAIRVTLSQTNCCRDTEQEYKIADQMSVISDNGSSFVRFIKWCLQQYCFEVAPERVQWRVSPDDRWQRVPGTRRCHWKGSVADGGPAGLTAQ